MTKSKKNLIDKLMSIYPYSRQWFEQKKEAILWAMLNSYKPPKKTVVADSSSSIIRVIDGEKYIKTESGQWEEMID